MAYSFLKDCKLCFVHSWCTIHINWLKIFRDVRTSLLLFLSPFWIYYFTTQTSTTGVLRSLSHMHGNSLHLILSWDLHFENICRGFTGTIHWSTTSQWFKQDCSPLADWEELIPLSSYNWGLALTLLQPQKFSYVSPAIPNHWTLSLFGLFVVLPRWC